MVEELFLTGRAAPAPKEHFFSDDLMAALVLLDDVATAEEKKRGFPVHLGGANNSGSRSALILDPYSSIKAPRINFSPAS